MPFIYPGFGINFAQPVIAIRVEDDSGEQRTYVFHLWSAISSESSVEVSTKTAQAPGFVTEASRRIPSTFRVTIGCTDSQDLVLPDAGPGALQGNGLGGARSQAMLLEWLLNRHVLCFTRSTDIEGIVSRVNINDDGKYDNTILVELEIRESRLHSGQGLPFGTFGTASIPAPPEDVSMPAAIKQQMAVNPDASVGPKSVEKIIEVESKNPLPPPAPPLQSDSPFSNDYDVTSARNNTIADKSRNPLLKTGAVKVAIDVVDDTNGKVTKVHVPNRMRGKLSHLKNMYNPSGSGKRPKPVDVFSTTDRKWLELQSTDALLKRMSGKLLETTVWERRNYGKQATKFLP